MSNTTRQNPGFYSSSFINHLEESSILFQQLPFLIGMIHSVPIKKLHSIVQQSTSEDFYSTLCQGLQTDITFEDLVDNLKGKTDRHQLFDLAKNINQCNIFNVTDLNSVEIIHLNNNHDTDSCSEPDETCIQDMVNRFLEALYTQGKLFKIIKRLLLNDIIDLLTDIVQSIEQSTDGKIYRNSMFKNAQRQIVKFIHESFVLSFNGSRYDLPLIITHMYRYQIESNRCKIKTFRKGSIYTSITISWNK